MAAPYVSFRRLADNSISAMLAAIEVYNKPQMAYRDEVTVMLVVNAWELALKATIRKRNRSVFYPKKLGQPYRSLSLNDAIGQITAGNYWPDGVDGVAVSANLQSLTNYRDLAIHLYNAEGLGTLLYSYLQQNVLNYRDFMMGVFKKDLAERISWQLLPLGATLPADAVEFMRVDKKMKMSPAVEDFINDLRVLMEGVEAVGSDPGRVAAMYDIHMQSTKKMTSADLAVSVSPSADARVLERKVDANQTHPYNMTTLLKKINKKRKGRELNSYDFQAACWKHKLRESQKYAWKHNSTGSHLWSGDTISFFASLTDADIDRLRVGYSASLKEVLGKKRKTG